MASNGAPEAGRLWGGRFTGATDPLMMQYNASIFYDRAFFAQDIAGSIAYARANVKTGILTQTEFKAIEQGLKKIEEEWKSNAFEIKPEIDEDIHTANERRLGEIIGKDVAGKLHTGRSRNDQVATDMRMWLRDQLLEIDGWLSDFLKAFAARAEQEMEVLMPGYTHLQRAQPIRWSHWLMSYGLAFAKDLDRLREVRKRVNLCPLGFGALAGNPFNIDREAMAEELGFDEILENSLAGVADRDFAVETMQWGAMFMLHISRWAEDLIIYSTAEFGYVQLADAYSTGSSIMPQKKNPDSLELLRGKSGRAFGQMTGLMFTVKGIPSTYNKDLQESVEPLLDHIKTVGDSVRIATGVLSTLKIFPQKMLAALSPDMLATDVAEYLVRKGVPFREAHKISGAVVKKSELDKVPMDKLLYQDFKSIDGRFGEDIMETFDFHKSVELKSTRGGTSLSSIKEQIAVLKATIRTTS